MVIEETHSVRKFLLLFAEPLVIRPRFLKPKEEANWS